MEAITLPVYNTDGKEVESVKLNTSVFDAKINSAAVYQTVNNYLANQRRGLAATKTRGEVSGGGRKPWKQKGTGRSRVGSIRSPLWRHGGVTFGPLPRDFSYTIPQKIKALALKSALGIKLKENNLMVLDDIRLERPKTSAVSKIMTNLKLNSAKDKSVLLLVDKMENNLKISLRNIAFLDANLARDTHAYEILAHRKLIITKGGLDELTKRLK